MDSDLEEAYKEIEQYLLENVNWFDAPTPTQYRITTASGTLTSINKTGYENIPGYDARSQTAGGLSIETIINGYVGPEVRLAKRIGGGYFYCLIKYADDRRKLPSGMTQHSTGKYYYHYRCRDKECCTFCKYWDIHARSE